MNDLEKQLDRCVKWGDIPKLKQCINTIEDANIVIPGIEAYKAHITNYNKAQERKEHQMILRGINNDKNTYKW